MSEKKLKSIAFDLDTKALQEYYTKSDWHNAYNDINNFLNHYGFTHMQGSVYDSTTKMTDYALGDLIVRMSKTLTWLPSCVKSIRGYDQPVMIDYTSQIKDKIQSNKTLQKAPTKENLQKDSAKEQLRQQVKEIAQKLKKDKKDKNISKDKGIER